MHHRYADSPHAVRGGVGASPPLGSANAIALKKNGGELPAQGVLRKIAANEADAYEIVDLFAQKALGHIRYLLMISDCGTVDLILTLGGYHNDIRLVMSAVADEHPPALHLCDLIVKIRQRYAGLETDLLCRQTVVVAGAENILPYPALHKVREAVWSFSAVQRDQCFRIVAQSAEISLHAHSLFQYLS